jgi:hypothetical protein
MLFAHTVDDALPTPTAPLTNGTGTAAGCVCEIPARGSAANTAAKRLALRIEAAMTPILAGNRRC